MPMLPIPSEAPKLLRTPLLIIGVVAGYSLFETALLLIFLFPEEGPSYPGLRLSVVAFAQFLIIPGIAALFSLVLYGEQQWKRRVLVILLAGVVGPPVAVFMGGSTILLLAWAFDTSHMLFFGLLPILLGSGAWLLLFVIRKTGQQTVPLEAARWLADRDSNSNAIQRGWRNRAIRWSLWVPSIFVLALFLFFPEVWGLLTHIQQPQSSQLSGYEITVPPTWIILFHYADPRTGASSVGGIAGRGMGLDVSRYLHFGDLPLSSWNVGTAEFDAVGEERGLSNTKEEMTQHDFEVGKGTLTCFESSSLRNRRFRTSAEPLAVVECSGPNRLRAGFVGERTHLSAFYRMLSIVSPALPKVESGAK